jgi:hypothetical protein
MDLAWPSVEYLGRAMGRRVRPFWPGIPARTVKRITSWLARSKQDWQMEMSVIEQMRALRPKLKRHRHEWDSLLLMAETMDLQRRADFALREVDVFHPDCRPIDTEWQRRIKDQRSILRDIKALRKKIIDHFSKRYHGTAFEEWARDLFDLRAKRLKECMAVCRGKKAAAAKRYRAVPAQGVHGLGLRAR